MVPVASLKKFSPGVSVSLNLALTRNIFYRRANEREKNDERFKEIFINPRNFRNVKSICRKMAAKILSKAPSFFSVLGKSLDLAIYANKHYMDDDGCDLKITPDFKNCNRVNLSAKTMKKYYEIGRQSAKENLPRIKELIEKKCPFDSVFNCVACRFIARY